MNMTEYTYFRWKKSGNWSPEELERFIKVIEGKT